MTDIILKLTEEKDELDGKIHRLQTFIRSVSFDKISVQQQTWLKIQLPTMEVYSTVLGIRLDDLRYQYNKANEVVIR